MSTVGKHDYDILDPDKNVVVDDDLDPRMLTNWTCKVSFKVRDKQQYKSEVPTSASMIRGRLRGSGERVVQVCTTCRRLTVLCDCLASADIRINGDRAYLNSVTKANPELMSTVRSTWGASDTEYNNTDYTPVQYLHAASFKYY
ncbi:hypothetical protein HDU81_007240 [Chytriomyces hyalinus]|nr:hypothetical protein HDU81_007240 [Chytriomyces hyalinus]